MKLSLYQKLAGALCAIFILVASLFMVWTQQVSYVSRHHAEQTLHLSLAEHLVGDNPLLSQGVYDYKALENLFHTLMVLGPSFEFYFVDPNGKLITYSAKPGDVKRSHIDLVPLISLIENQHELPIYGDDPRSLDGSKIFSVSPVFNNQQLQGYLYVIIGSQAFETIFNTIQLSETLQLSAIWIAITLFLLLISLLILFRYLTKPLTQLKNDVTAIEKAKFNLDNISLHRWLHKDNNEIHMLGQSVNVMASKIDSQLKQLEQIDLQRKEMLAHLSHDLRTPLASLQGYLELLVDKKVSDAEQQHSFLSVSLNNCGQIKHMIDQIFELAHLESGHVNTHFEVINLGELAYDISAKFALKVERKKIELIIDTAVCDVMVYADIAKLERVLSNLLENAIRHTPVEGKININLQHQGSNVYVSVKDSGTGIHEADLSYIFEARYRASNAIGSNKKHGGLGLAITKQLLTLLNSEIRVQSELGQGSDFSFKLRVAS